jgi:hypothetical protein
MLLEGMREGVGGGGVLPFAHAQCFSAWRN